MPISHGGLHLRHPATSPHKEKIVGSYTNNTRDDHHYPMAVKRRTYKMERPLLKLLIKGALTYIVCVVCLEYFFLDTYQVKKSLRRSSLVQEQEGEEGGNDDHNRLHEGGYEREGKMRLQIATSLRQHSSKVNQQEKQRIRNDDLGQNHHLDRLAIVSPNVQMRGDQDVNSKKEQEGKLQVSEPTKKSVLVEDSIFARIEDRHGNDTEREVVEETAKKREQGF